MNNKEIYLSSTSLLPEFEIDKPVVFLNESSITESILSRLKCGYEVIPPLWANQQNFEKAYNYLENLIMKVLPKIGEELNRIHKLDYSVEFWKIPLIFWLINYLHLLFDRYSRLKKAIQIYGENNCTLFVYRKKIAPVLSLYEFWETYSGIEQSVSVLYGEVAKVMCIPIYEFTSDTAITQITRLFIHNNSIFKRVIYSITKGFKYQLVKLLSNNPVSWNDKQILMGHYYFDIKDKYYFMKTINTDYCSFDKIRTQKRNIDRGSLSTIPADDEFESLVYKLLPRLMPAYYLEEFESYITEAKKYSHYKIFFVTTEFYDNTVLNYAASLGRLNGAKIVGCQHGACYGQFENVHSEFIEREVSDIFITWGWKKSNNQKAKLISLPQPRFASLTNQHKEKLPSVLWASYSTWKQMAQFQEKRSELMPQILKWKKIFLSSLMHDVRSNLIYRHGVADYGWFQEEKKIFNKYLEIKWEFKGLFENLIKDIRLFVCDFAGSSFHETFVANTPTVIFWNRDINPETEEAIPVFDLLRKAGILFHDPRDAADHVNTIWHDVQGWWQRTEVQKAKDEFCHQFARTSKDWRKEWVEFLRGLGDKN